MASQSMGSGPRILVATDRVADADLVRRLLRDEFDSVASSVDPDRLVADFEQHRPSVLILAFDALEKAERHYLGLHRLGHVAHVLPHRTVLLCGKDDLQRVYDLCRRRYFDDYVLFWPMPQDATRLPMSVHHALRDLATERPQAPGAAAFAAQARRIAELELLLEQTAAAGVQRVDAASRSLHESGQDIGSAVASFTRRMAEGGLGGAVEVKDRDGLLREVDRLRSEEIAPRVDAVDAALRPVQQWAGEMTREFARYAEPLRALGRLADQVKPLVLLVDDDEFQHKLVGRLLTDARLELACAASALEAFAFVRRRHPDLVLMDLDLPDIGGVEAVRRLKGTESMAEIPVVMITAHSEREVIVDSLRAGACDFVVKPFEREVLVNKVLRQLDTRQQPPWQDDG